MPDQPSTDKQNSRPLADDVTAAFTHGSLPPRPVQQHRAVPLGSMLGKYRVTGVLGRGGGGDVYAAEDSLIKRHVAIKMLPPELATDAALLSRFMSEAQAAGRLNHPNVVTIYEITDIGGSYALVMELVSGGSVQDYLVRKGSPGWRAATRSIGEACKALIAAHDAGLIHRDIKPANLLLTNEGHVKVADFGLAKLDASDSTMHTQAGVILGTPAFMSPEQCRGDKIDARTDIYSLGCTYYAMLTGKPPYEAASSMQVMFAHCSSPIPNPRDLKADTPPECSQILTKALAKDVNERYANAREMFNDLRAVLGGTTISSPNTSSMGSHSPIAISEPISIPEHELPQGAVTLMPTIAPRQKNLLQRKPWLVAVAGLAGLVLLVILIPFMIPAKHPAVVQDDSPEPEVKPQPREVSYVPPVPKSVVTIPPVPSTPPVTVTTQPVPTTSVAVTSSLPATKPAPIVFDQAKLNALPLRITNSIHQQFARILPGKFVMGDNLHADAPRHEVTLTQPFYMGVCEVSQGDYDQLLGANSPTPEKRKNLPAAFAAWEDATRFCQLLSALPEEKAAGHVYRLPTEAQWEYACRAGTTTRFSWGNTLDKQHANFGKNINLATLPPPDDGATADNQPASALPQPTVQPQYIPPPPPPGPGGPYGPRGGRPPQQPVQPQVQPVHQHVQQHLQERPLEPVDAYPANPWGLKSMHGGVWEWCSDFYSPDTYKSGPQVDPTGPTEGANHVARGGCWASVVDECGSAYRNGVLVPDSRIPNTGFRVVLEVHP